jgi:hypothetical protein
VSYLIRMSADRPATSCSPSSAGLRQACDLFERFHCFRPWDLKKFSCRRLMPKLLVRVGDLRGLIYRSDRGQPGCPRTFVHFLESPAELACDASGRQLYILGGNYRVTRRGIEG